MQVATFKSKFNIDKMFIVPLPNSDKHMAFTDESCVDRLTVNDNGTEVGLISTKDFSLDEPIFIYSAMTKGEEPVKIFVMSNKAPGIDTSKGKYI
jgi:hypothetical protein